ncbi:MAG: glycosyltransferase family 2 protein [Nitrospirae bacterium]|nr:glycosyltransferase family 2 protein [Candidatus Manganitrophaceae bacterium]
MGLYLPSPQTTSRRERYLQRVFEIVPGLLLWTTFSALLIFSFVRPVWVAIFIIAYDLYWLIRVTYFSIFMFLAYRRVRMEWGTDWRARCERVSKDLAVYRREAEAALAQQEIARAPRQRRQSLHVHVEELRQLEEKQVQVWDWRRIYHVVIFPTYREGIEILRASLNALLQADYPSDRMIIVMAFEEREGIPAYQKAKALRAEFGASFSAFLTTFHPDGIPGEARVKGANLSWAGRQVRRYLDENQIAYEEVVLSAFDADTCVDRQYFGCLTYNYIIHPDRTRRSYQPLPMYHNNIWDAPSFARVVANSTTFWHMVQSIRPDLLITFSSHAMSFKALVEVGYWPVDVISDDSVIFFSCYLYYDGNYETVPLYVPVSMDANLAESYWKTLINQYKQMRRWAWGIEKFPLMMRGFLAERRIPLRKKIKHVFRILEGNYSWASAPFVIPIFGMLPLWVGGRQFQETVLAYNFISMTRSILSVSLIGVVLSVFLCHALLPPRPPRYGQWRTASMTLQWALVPFSYIFLVGLPAVDAQTRMMLGKYLTFWVTDKRRKEGTAEAPTPVAVLPATATTPAKKRGAG